ncbi:hypothetical protein [Microlunatus sp. GCM10028923]|uniref:hypothetical protein n=1 Tax=Microlunatus sp. GCM10028923 TaxID=3273400 RepID=UPI00361F2822
MIVPVVQPADLAGLLGSLDRQSLRLDEFEVVVAVPASAGPEATGPTVSAGRRPNLRIVADETAASEAELAAAAIRRATGDWVLTVRPEDRLLPRSLELLTVEAPEADLVVGRSVGLAGAFTDPVVFGLAASTEDLLAAAVREPAVLIRRGLATAAPVAVLPGGRAPLLAAEPAVAVLADYPALDLRGRGRWQPEPTSDPSLLSGAVADRLRSLDTQHQPVSLAWDRPTLRWTDGRLQIEATGRVSGLAAGDPEPAGVLRVREPASGAELILPARTQWLSAGDADGARGVRLQADLDPRSGWNGRPLDSAIYQLYGDLVAIGIRAQAPLRGGAPSGAVLDGRPVGVVTIDDRLHLDAGCVRASLVQQAEAGDASITDSARGTLLRLTLPRIVAEPGTELAGEIGLGGLRVPARIVEQDGVGVLEAYVSGLSGQVRLSTRFGTARTPLDLLLDVSPIGRMQVIPQPVAAPKAAPVPPKVAAVPAKAPVAKPTAPKPAAAAPKPSAKPVGSAAVLTAPRTAKAVYRRIRRLIKSPTQ